MKDIRIIPIKPNEFNEVIAFDNKYLINAMKETGVPEPQLLAVLTTDELEKAF